MNKMQIIIAITTLALLAGAALWYSVRNSSRSVTKPGSLYAKKGDDDLWRVYQILSIDRMTVNVRLFKNRYQSIPAGIDTSELTIAMTAEDLESDPIPISAACLPIRRQGFFTPEAHFIGYSPIEEI